MEIVQTILIVSVISFMLSIALYGNPWISRVYQKSTKIGTIKTWKKQSKFLAINYLATFIEVTFFTWIFSIITIHPATEWFIAGLYFGLFLCMIRIIPRALDLYMMVNYPKKLLLIELFNGLTISIFMGMGISFFIF